MSGRYLSEWLFDWNVMRRGHFSRSGAKIVHVRETIAERLLTHIRYRGRNGQQHRRYLGAMQEAEPSEGLDLLIGGARPAACYLRRRGRIYSVFKDQRPGEHPPTQDFT
jgi:hypothetical protein